MQLVHKLICYILIFNLSNLFAKTQLDYTPYVVQEGDTLSEVLKKHDFKPLYGKDKWVEDVLELNRLSFSSTKKLKKGDVVVLPIKRTAINKVAYITDFISKSDAATLKHLATEKEYESGKSRHKLSAGMEYYYTDINFSTGTGVNVSQNIGLNINYSYQNYKRSRGLRVTPSLNLKVITQDKTSFDHNDNLTTEFTPSFVVSSAFDIEAVERSIKISPLFNYEYISNLDDTAVDNFKIRKDHIFSAGLKVQKDFNLKYSTIFANTYGLKSIFSTEDTNIAQDSKELSQIVLGGTIGYSVFKGNIYEIFAENKRIKANQDSTLSNVGLRVGRNF